jgi:hypothetical protein
MRHALFAPFHLAGRIAPAALLLLALAPAVHAEDAAQWLGRAAQAARQLSYVGTIVYQIGARVETSRLAHLNDNGTELEKLVSLDGPAREVVRTPTDVRYYYPDVKMMKVEARTFRNAFPSLSPKQLESLARYYTVRKGGTGRVAGLEAEAWKFVPRDGLRYGHEFWTEPASGRPDRFTSQLEARFTARNFGLSDRHHTSISQRGPSSAKKGPYFQPLIAHPELSDAVCLERERSCGVSDFP